MVTKSHRTSLKPDQELAISALLAGKTVEQAGKIAGVTRECINRWKNHDPFFRAAYHKKSQEIWEDNKKKLRSLVSTAIETISEAVRDNPAIAMKILEKCQGLDVIQPPSGPTTAEGILREATIIRAEQELASIRQEESGGQLLITDPFEDARELRPLIEKHFLVLKREHGLQ